MLYFEDLKDIFFTPSIIIGPIRILFLIGFVFVVKRIISLRASNQLGLDYIISRYTIATSSIISICFLLNLINAFDFISVLIISFLVVIFAFLNLDPKKSIRLQLKKIRTRIIIYSVKKVELNQRFFNKNNIKKPKDNSKTDQVSIPKHILYWQIGIAISLALITFFYRYYFFLYDKYMLSGLWFKDYKIVKNITIKQEYFNQISGEYALINLYSKITGITEAIALQSFGLLESSILSVTIFWGVYKITKGYVAPALVASFSFIFLFHILPFNMYLITKHSSLYLAMSLTIPVIIYSSEPGSLRAKTNSYLKWMTLLYFAIALTNLFVFLVVIPCFLVIIFFTIEKQRRVFFFRNVYAYGIATLIFSIFYYIKHVINDGSFVEFVKSNILVISSYTYSPQLVLPIKELMAVYWYIALFAVILSFILLLYDRTSWRWSLAFNCFTALLLTIYNLNFNFIDNDLMHVLATLILPITFGCLVYVVIYILKKMTAQLHLKIPLIVIIPFTTAMCVVTFFYVQKKGTFPFKKTPSIKSDVLQAYTEIETSFLNYKYTIIDNKEHHDMSSNSHFFNNYNYFNNKYLKQDSIFFKNRLDNFFLKQHPDIVLTESTLVFIYDTHSSQQQTKALQVLSTLKKRGRTVTIFFERPQLKVFEIVNTPKSSKISDLLF